MPDKVKIGSKIPSFSLKDQNGNDFSINDLLGKKNLVIYFYPKDDTPGCTKEACSFRDSYEDFQGFGAEVIGISDDGQQKHQEFSQKHDLPFILLSDNKKEVRRLFGVPTNLLGFLPGRVTYVVDKKGIVRHIFNSQMNPSKHISESKKILSKL